jgi:hypothetical protein
MRSRPIKVFHSQPMLRRAEQTTSHTWNSVVFSPEPEPIMAHDSPSLTVHDTSRKTGEAKFGSPNRYTDDLGI